MKKTLMIASLVLSFNAFAGEDASVDCSKVQQGIVKITSVNSERMSNQEAVSLAYQCMIKRNGHPAVRNAKVQALKEAFNFGKDIASKKNCGRMAKTQPLETITLKSWYGERPGFTGTEGLMEIGSEETLLVRQPITCNDIGTGLFSGTVSAVNLKMEVSENFVFSTEDDKKSTQKIQVELKGVLKDI